MKCPVEHCFAAILVVICSNFLILWLFFVWIIISFQAEDAQSNENGTSKVPKSRQDYDKEEGDGDDDDDDDEEEEEDEEEKRRRRKKERRGEGKVGRFLSRRLSGYVQ